MFSPPEATAEPAARSLREEYADWPQKGGDDRPQPWDLDAHDLDPRTFPKPGEPDTVSPVLVEHGRPMLSAGSQGEAVRELADRLAKLGYSSSYTSGENAHNVLDRSLLEALLKFRADYGIKPAPLDVFGVGDSADRAAESHVGPYDWEALIRVSDDPAAHGADRAR